MHAATITVSLANVTNHPLLALEMDINDPEMRRYMGLAIMCLFAGLALRITCGLFNMLLKPGAMIPSANILRCLLVVILAWGINYGIVFGLSQVSPQYFVKILDLAGGRHMSFQDTLTAVSTAIFGIGVLQVLLQALLIRLLLGARFGYGIVIAMLNIEVTALLLAILGTAFSIWLAK